MDPPTDAPRRRARPAVATLGRAGRAVTGTLADAALRAVAPLAGTARAGAFWAAVLLPFVHVPLLLVAGLTATTTPPLVALWTLHAVVLAAGAGYEPDRRPDEDVEAPDSAVLSGALCDD